MSDDGLHPVPEDDLEFAKTVTGFIENQVVFGRYRLRQIVGRGGMGVVWLAQDEKLEQEVALKFLPEVVRLDAAALDELKRETRRSRSLTHPHVVRIHDFVDDATAAAISMEFVNGATLSALRVQQPNRILEADPIAEWIRQLAEALYYAHHKVKIVHRDLKPANLMINAEGDLKVTDFGIARSISDTVSRVTIQRGASGTLVYMSPQQAMGHDPSVSDDIYAVGATIYELLTSKPPFYGGDILAQLRETTPPTMTQRRAALGIEGGPIPPAWEQTVAACLAKQPEQRPPGIAQVAEQLGLESPAHGTRRTHGSGQPQSSGFGTPRPGPIWKSHSLWIGAGLALVVLCGALGWYFGYYRPSWQNQIQQANLAEQQALEKDKEAEAQATAIAAAKAKADADAATAKAVASAPSAAAAPALAPAVINFQTPLDVVQQRAEAGDATAQVELAGRYDYGYGGTPIDFAIARSWLEKAVGQGNAIAEARLSSYYMLGLGGAVKDPAQAIALCQKSVDAGEPLGYLGMGYYYRQGLGVVKDDTQARNFFRQAAQIWQLRAVDGDAAAMRGMGDVYAYGVDRDPAQVLNWYRQAAGLGDPVSQWRLGNLYKNGVGCQKDFTQALAWFQKAADQGDAPAQTDIGTLYANGQGVPQDYQQAYSWFQKAADLNYPVAQYSLGHIYMLGEGVPRDYQQALAWFQKAAAQNNADAECCLGIMYTQGLGVTQDYPQGIAWFQKAAAQNESFAEDHLGNLYAEGKGVPADYQQAFSWFQKSAALGNADGENDLGVMYAGGYGTTKDTNTAVQWYRKALADGNAKAADNLRKLGVSP